MVECYLHILLSSAPMALRSYYIAITREFLSNLKSRMRGVARGWLGGNTQFACIKVVR